MLFFYGILRMLSGLPCTQGIFNKIFGFSSVASSSPRYSLTDVPWVSVVSQVVFNPFKFFFIKSLSAGDSLCVIYPRAAIPIVSDLGWLEWKCKYCSVFVDFL